MDGLSQAVGIRPFGPTEFAKWSSVWFNFFYTTSNTVGEEANAVTPFPGSDHNMRDIGHQLLEYLVSLWQSANQEYDSEDIGVSHAAPQNPLL